MTPTWTCCCTRHHCPSGTHRHTHTHPRRAGTPPVLALASPEPPLPAARLENSRPGVSSSPGSRHSADPEPPRRPQPARPSPRSPGAGVSRRTTIPVPIHPSLRSPAILPFPARPPSLPFLPSTFPRYILLVLRPNAHILLRTARSLSSPGAIPPVPPEFHPPFNLQAPERPTPPLHPLPCPAYPQGHQHAGEKRGVAGLLLGRTERAARAAELQLCAQAR